MEISRALKIAPALASLPERELVYNDANRLYQLIEDGTLTTAYLYNDTGQRTRKITYQSDGQTVDTITVYHYDMMGYLVTETTETGALIKDYIWREGMNPVAQIDSSSGAEQVSYLHTDHLMTNRLATNTAQQVIWRWEGEAFGNTPAQELASIQVNLRFPGQYYDAETNLHYNWNRYYDPELGRYITSDPIGLSGGMNTYGYAGQSALMAIDPMGLRWSPAEHGQTWADHGMGQPNNEYQDQINQVGYTDAYKGLQAERKARESTKNETRIPGMGHNDSKDAYRHCVWSCTVSRATSESTAETMGNIHEAWNKANNQPPWEENMDQANNKAGRECASRPGSCEQNCFDAHKNCSLFGLGGLGTCGR